MEKDNFNNDDNLGEAIIPLEAVFEEGSLAENAYKLVKEQEYCGEIKVALTFTPERNDEEETCGGWKESTRDF